MTLTMLYCDDLPKWLKWKKVKEKWILVKK